MAETVEELTIQWPAGDVWRVLADFGAISGWAPNVDHSCLTTQSANGIGATRRIQTGRTTVLETITTWEPGHRLSYSISGLPPVIRSVTNTWTLNDLGETVDVTLTSTVDAGPRPPQQAVARVACRALAKASRQLLAGLDRHVGEQQRQQQHSPDQQPKVTP